jgi:transcriptional regulator of nitric oxide reductase
MTVTVTVMIKAKVVVTAEEIMVGAGVLIHQLQNQHRKLHLGAVAEEIMAEEAITNI